MKSEKHKKHPGKPKKSKGKSKVAGIYSPPRKTASRNDSEKVKVKYT